MLKYLYEFLSDGAWMSKIIVENNRLILEFRDPDKLSKFIELLRMLGVTSNVERKEIMIHYDGKFRDYLEKDRQLSPRTVDDYMRYLRKLDGKVINYDLYLEISNNKWLVKCIRLYLDYLYKKNEISWEELQKLKSIFRIKKRTSINNHRIDEEGLIESLYDERLKEEELLLLKTMLYSGIRFSESVKLVNEFDESKIECFQGFCRYELFWSRGRKRCDWVYLPIELVKEIEKHRGRFRGVKIHSLSRRLEKKLGISLKLFRKLHYRLCRSFLDKEICDFYQSRISKLSVGDIHYDNLLEKCDKNYPKLVKRIQELIDRILSEIAGIPDYNEEDVEQHYEEGIYDEEERTVYEFSIEKDL